MIKDAKWRNSKLLVGLVLAKLVHSVRAEGTSGAIVWWIIFTICALAAGTGYLIYMQYVQKKPLGKHHPNYAEADFRAAEEAKRRTPGDRRYEEDKDARNLAARDNNINLKNKEDLLKKNIRQDVSKPVTRPEDVKYFTNFID